MINLIKDARDLCINKKPFVMASIIFKHGSAPREVGATMIVTEDGYYSGTIGGGLQEFESINHSKELIKLKKCDKKYYEVSKEVAAENGMVCGGKNIVYFQYIDIQNEKNLEYFEKIIEEINDNDVYLIYDVENYTGNLGISIEVGQSKYPFTGYGSNESNIFKIKIKKPMKIYIFGGGHIAKATVQVLGFLDLDIIIIDDIEDFIKQKEFDKAHRKIINFNDLDKIDIDKSDYVLVMTRGHKYDVKVLESVLKKHPYYVGVVGNKIKAENYKRHFKGTSLEYEFLNKVHIPVGINISALTPEEIAISIAAQVIESYRTNK